MLLGRAAINGAGTAGTAGRGASRAAGSSVSRSCVARWHWGRARRPGRRFRHGGCWRWLVGQFRVSAVAGCRRCLCWPRCAGTCLRISTPGGRRPACGLVGEALPALPAAARCGLVHPGPLIKVLHRALWGIGGVCPLYLQGLQLLISARVMAWQTGRGLPIRRRAHPTAQRATANECQTAAASALSGHVCARPRLALSDLPAGIERAAALLPAWPGSGGIKTPASARSHDA